MADDAADPEQFLRHGCAEQGHLGAGAQLLGLEVAPLVDLPAAGDEVVAVDGLDGGRPVEVAHHGLAVAAQGWRGGDDFGDFALEGDGIGFGEALLGTYGRSGAAAAGGAGAHHEDVAAHGLNLAIDFGLGAGAHRDHGDDGGDADDDAEDRQRAAQEVDAQGAECDAEELKGVHGIGLLGRPRAFGGTAFCVPCAPSGALTCA